MRSDYPTSMSWLNRIKRRLHALFARRRLEAELADELRTHLEMQAEAYRTGGMEAEEARYAARRQFGHLDGIKETVRDQRSWLWLERLGQIFRFAVRSLARSPAFTITSIATLAFCLGANVTISSVVDAILLRPLPYPQSGRLVSVSDARAGESGHADTYWGASIPDYYEWGRNIGAFASVALYKPGTSIVDGSGAPRFAQMARVSPEFFLTFGISLAMGHAFSDAQMTPAADRVVVLTDGFWRSHFDADPNVLGRSFLSDGVSVTVIGVLPKSYRFPFWEAPQFFLPAASRLEERSAAHRHDDTWTIFARLAPGMTLADAQAEIDASNARLTATDPLAEAAKSMGFHSIVSPLHEKYVRSIRPTLVLLQCGCLILLLISIVNLTNLLLIRASSRARELAIRMALGAGKRHIAAEVAAETILLSFVGGLFGLLLGYIGIGLLRWLGVDQLPLGDAVNFDLRTSALWLAASILIGLVLAAPIIWIRVHARFGASLQIAPRGGTAGRPLLRLHHSFIVIQIALAFVLLSTAGLLSISLKRLLETPSGFRADGVLAGRLILPVKSYPSMAARLAFVERLLPAVRALPGVSSAAVTTGLPFASGARIWGVAPEGYQSASGATFGHHYLGGISADYCQVMGIPVLKGRTIDQADNLRDERVCVVDQSVAQRYWPGLNPVGRRLSLGTTFMPKRSFEVVGVVGNVKQYSLGDSSNFGTIYFTYMFFNYNMFYLVVRTALPPATVTPMLEHVVRHLDPGLPIADVHTMRARIDDTLPAQRAPAVLADIFAGIALILGTVGTYGVLGYAVSLRRREIGIRMALGARPSQILAHFLSLGARLLGLGVALGLVGTWASARAMQGMLFEVGTQPYGLLAGATGLMLGIVFVAVWLPSRRAARLDPLTTLRAE